MDYLNKVGFAIGTGRCGTLFLHQLMEKEPHVASSHERNPDNETFHRYCKWHGLPVDDEGFLTVKEREIGDDLASHAYSFEASPYVSLSVRELHDRFGAKFVLLLRRPDGVVTSFAHKGFYRRPYAVRDPELATGYQDPSPEKVHTFFARVAPRGAFFHAWNEMTPVGKVAWFWKAWNERALELLEQLPRESYRVVRIEDFSYETYREVAAFLGFEARVDKETFDDLRTSKPHAFWRKRNVDQWMDQEAREFESQVGALAERFGYAYRVADLIGDARAERARAQELGHVAVQRKGPQFWRLRRATANWLRGVGDGLRGLGNGLDVD